MSVTDPLVKELKGWTRKLTECGTEIDDKNPDLADFCGCLEKCFQKGVLMRLNAIGFPKMPEAWYWMDEFGLRHERSLFAFSSAVELVRDNEKVQTPVGRLRLFIRIALTRKCIHVAVQTLVRTSGYALEYYEANSIIGDEILGEIFLSVLMQISKMRFKLDLKNASFLDETWQLPEYTFMELVPCKILGISVCFTGGKALIVSLQENSVAAEDDKIEVGDVLDEINGNVITSSTRGKLRKILRKSAGLPISLHIIKARYRNSQEYYGPIVKLFRASGLDRSELSKSPKSTSPTDQSREKKIQQKSDKQLSSGLSVKYCGSVSTGNEGDVKQIEGAIRRLVKSGEYKKISVRFECLEIGIRITQETNENVLMNQSYMEISSCGRTANIPDYFAFIAGDTNCNVATKFEAHVFHHERDSEVQTILQSLGQGFQRTHFAV